MRRIALAILAGSLVVGLLAAPVSARRPGPTLVETAIAVNASGPFAGSFDTLIAAVVDAGLAPALSGNRQLTVFAPTDAAFAALGLNAGNIGAVPDDTLRSILLYHVAPGRRDAASVLDSSSIRTLQGGRLAVSVRGGAAYVNDSRIIVTDVRTSNGIIHVIDAVLLP